MGLFDRLKSGLAKTRQAIAAAGWLGETLGEADLRRLESALLGADLGAALTAKALDGIRSGSPESAPERLAAALSAMLPPSAAPGLYDASPLAKPEVSLIVGVNGSGKTTSCGKLAAHFSSRGEKVLLAGADTFRAAAVEQLQLWAARAKADFFSQGAGADPAAVAFDAVSKARASGHDRLLIDTAGRLQTKSNLMEELSKVQRVTAKAMPGAPHRVLLVLDGTAGQNMLSQARLFNQAVPLSGLIITKLDGTSKAGAVLSVCHELKLPVLLVGVGEAAEDLQPFVAESFIRAMVG